MLTVLKHPTYRLLFSAQVIALIGTGLATVALGLLAYQLAGEQAGLVLGTALAIKMIAYVVISPIAAAYINRFSRRHVLIVLDVIRALIALALPFVDQVWQIYLLIFLLQSASAAFTPTFQATIPDILPDEREYTKALSLSRLAYDLESLLSPALAAGLLSVISFHGLFAGTSVGFIVSAGLIFWTVLPIIKREETSAGFYDRLMEGIQPYLATPRLRALFSLNLTVAAAGALVIVTTVVFVPTVFHRGETDVAVALAVFGAGSMISALLLPRILETISDRQIMLSGGLLLVAVLFIISFVAVSGVLSWLIFLGLWGCLGLAYSAIMTPSGRLLRRSSTIKNRPAIFAAQFALSHACWLVTYPLAGWLSWRLGLAGTALALGAMAAIGVGLALYFWPSEDADVLAHRHHDLPSDHPHLKGAKQTPEGLEHCHPFIIDDLHKSWPS